MIFPFVETALVNLKSSSKLNQGVVNFLELLQQLRPFLWRVGKYCLLTWLMVILFAMKVSAAIHERFPDCSIFRRMKAFGCSAAQDFFAAWPGLCENANRELEAETTITSTFSEIPTQTAFMSLTARQKEFEAALRVQTAHLKILTRRTEPLSPSHTHLIAGGVATMALEDKAPNECSHRPTPSLPRVCGHHLASPQMDDASLTIPTSPAIPVPATPPTHINSTNSTPSNDLCIVAVNIGNLCFNVLRLSPGPMAPPTPFDIILPPVAAFYKTTDSVGAPYPSFTAVTCGWQAIFERIVQPSLLWDCWGPDSLGEYPDIMTLWKSWNEGAVVEGVGQKPPLHLVDAQWGCRKDQRSNKGHLPAWRPRRNDNVSDTDTSSQFLMAS